MTDEKKKPEEDEVGDEQLEDVAGGATVFANAAMGGPESGAIPPVMGTPNGGSGIPIPFPNSSMGGTGSKAVKIAGEAVDVPDVSMTGGD
jgi:hypothetical protein